MPVRRHNLRLPLLCCAAVLLAAPVARADRDDLDELQMKMTSEWQLVKNDRLRNIKTFARVEDGKVYRSFKAEATVFDVSPAAILRMLLDFDNYDKWYWQVAKSQLLRKVSPTEYYVYLVHRAPFGLPDRDVILHATVEPQSPGHPHAMLTVKADRDYLPLRPPFIRMRAEDMTFRFTPLPGNGIRIDAEGYVDPGGSVPGWAANMVQHSAPYSVALGALRMVRKDEYLNSRAPLPFPVYSWEELQK